MASPFKMDIWDRSFKWKGPLEALESAKISVRHNDSGSAVLGVHSSNPRIGVLNTPGTRVGVQFRGGHLISGLIESRKGSTAEGRGSVRPGTQFFNLVDDKQVLKNIKAWPNPLGTDAQQGDEAAYYTIGRRPAETVLKDVFTKNVVRRIGPAVMPFTVEPDLGRGGIMDATFRFHSIYDRMFPSFDLAGLGYNIRTQAGGRILEVYVPRRFPLPLSTDDRTVQSPNWSLQSPTVSRGVVQGQGQGKARVIKSFRSSAVEQEWGEVWEVSVDARDTDSGDIYTARGQEALLEGAARGSVGLDLIEAGYFVFGGPKGIKLGDQLAAHLNGGAASVVDVLREVTMSWDRENQLKISSSIGVKDDPTGPVLEAISTLGKSLRDLKVGQ